MRRQCNDARATLPITARAPHIANPLPMRVGAAVARFLAFLVMRRSVFAGVLVGEAVLLVGGYLFMS
jgi:hypothetical protein